MQRDSGHTRKSQKIDAETCEIDGVESSGNKHTTGKLRENHRGNDRDTPALRSPSLPCGKADADDQKGHEDRLKVQHARSSSRYASWRSSGGFKGRLSWWAISV